MSIHHTITVAALFLGLMSVNLFAVDKSIGIKGGFAISNLWGKNAEVTSKYENISSLYHFDGCGMFDIIFSEVFGIEVDAIYSQKGAIYEGYDTASSIYYKDKPRLSYLDLPVLAKVTFPIHRSVKPIIFAGPSLNIMLTAKEDYSETDLTDTTYDTKDLLSNFEIGLVFGTGVEIAAGPGKFLADLRYTLGLTTIDKLTFEEKLLGEIKASDIKNYKFAIMLGYSFKL